MGCLFSIFETNSKNIPLISSRNEVYFVDTSNFNEEKPPPGYNEVDDYYDELNRPTSFLLQRRRSLDYGWD